MITHTHLLDELLLTEQDFIEALITSIALRNKSVHFAFTVKRYPACGECGAPIGASAPRAGSTAQQTHLQLSDVIPATELIDGERKTVTALFSDIKGPMELMEDLVTSSGRRRKHRRAVASWANSANARRQPFQPA